MQKHAVDAIISRRRQSSPAYSDAEGSCYSGDLLGLITAQLLRAEFCANPVSANDMLDVFFAKAGVAVQKTKIGSPYVIAAMDAVDDKVVVGLEVNGGFMVGQNVEFNGESIRPLETRDAYLPLLSCLISMKHNQTSLNQLFNGLEPKRYGDTGMVDMDNFEQMKTILRS